MTLQLFTPERPPAIAAAIRGMAIAESDERGAVFTRPEIVGFLLDLVGYTADRPLHTMRALEPSFGGGDFLLPMISRLLAAWRQAGSATDLSDALLGVEIHHASYEATHVAAVELLKREGFSADESKRLVRAWLRTDDFLLTALTGSFDFVIGNPPYLRPERIPKPLLTLYRSTFKTMYDRADLYVAFIERSLDHLAPNGALAFVCANRWHKNKYGGPLRAKVDGGFHLEYHVDLVGVDAFNREVIAYPAITVVRRGEGTQTVIARQPAVDSRELAELVEAMRAPEEHAEVVEVAEGVTSGRDPWLLHDAQKLGLLRRIESMYDTIEDVGCRVGIGVATGRDRVFIRPIDELDVEPERKVPLIKAPDIRSGALEWSGLGLLNPYDGDGKLVALENWPKFAAELRRHEDDLRKRNVAKRHQDTWFRTIDKVHPNLLQTPKLLIPDIKGEPHVVYDPGKYYPHHNLYWVTSETWDLRALQAVLRSDVARLVIEAYCVVMAGGFLRFQAQYLRRIPVPRWADLTPECQEELASCGADVNMALVNAAVARAYGLGARDVEILARR